MSSELAKIESFRKDLAIAETVEEVKLITDASMAYQELMRRQKVSYEKQNEIGIFITECMSKLGSILIKDFPNGGNRGNKFTRISTGDSGKQPINHVFAHKARIIAGATDEVKEKVIEHIKKKGDVVTTNNVFKEIQAVRKQEKKDELPKVETPSGKYRIIYADCPWQYNDKQNTDMLGGAEKHYPTMSIQELCELPILDLSDDNAVLFMWVTSPLLEDSFKVINAWGFKYKSSFIWDKVKHNMGHYNSVRHEFLLICTKGSCTPDVVKLFDSVVIVERTDRHSEKPQEFRDIIDTIYPYGRRIELFARKQHINWETWGNEL